MENITVVNAREIAEELGEPRSQNIVILGGISKGFGIRPYRMERINKRKSTRKGT